MKQVTIFQINVNDNEQNAMRLFSSLSMLKRMGMSFDSSVYKVVYEGTMDVEDFEDVYMRLQWTKPNGYKGHSLSVSDIVLMDGKYMFCDSVGFVDVSDKY